MTTDAAIQEQLRAAWNRPAEEPIPETNRREWQDSESDRLVSETLDRINAACPAEWKPSSEDWQRIDRAEATIDQTRRDNDRPGLLAALTDYESVAVEIFASATSTSPTVAIDGKLTGTLLGIFDKLPTRGPLLPCFERYQHRAAWRSIHGPGWICAGCHPPATPEIVAETIELDADGQRTA